METVFILFLLIALVLLLQYGSKTYYMTPESLYYQLAKVNEQAIDKVYDFRLGLIPALLGGAQFYNGIKEVRVVDKNNHEFEIQVNKNSQIRITQKNKKRQTLYFDTMFIRDGYLYGNKTHFASIPIKPIEQKDIEKIEMQFRLSKKTKIE